MSKDGEQGSRCAGSRCFRGLSCFQRSSVGGTALRNEKASKCHVNGVSFMKAFHRNVPRLSMTERLEELRWPCVQESEESRKPAGASEREEKEQIWKRGIKMFRYNRPFTLKYHGVLPELNIAYETWGELNEKRDNVVMLNCFLTAGSHAKSHKDNPTRGWWEDFIGSGLAVDTDKYFVICASPIGGCFGTSGPSSINPETGKIYGMTFPIITIEDMASAMFLLLDNLGVRKVHSMIGASLGGMISLTAGILHPERVNSIATISSCLKTHGSNIAVNYLQSTAIMNDPHWNNGDYYAGPFPNQGMKLCREIATVTYRSQLEWNERFGRKRILPGEKPRLKTFFEAESYIQHQGNIFQWKHDPNSLLYTIRAIDLFDIADIYGSQEVAARRITCPVLVVGIQSDTLYPLWQQHEIAATLTYAGNRKVTHEVVTANGGHDAMVSDVVGIGKHTKTFLQSIPK